MQDLISTQANIKYAIDKIREHKDQIAIIVVANIKAINSQTTKHSLTTEFFAERECEDIISGFRTNGFYVELHKNEMDFIKWVTDGGIKHINKKFVAVYSAANSGKGPGKKALIPSFCNLNGIPITGSNPYVVGLCRHKYHYNAVLNYSGLPTPLSWYYHKDYEWLMNTSPPDGMLVIAKPTYESASVGVDEDSVFEYVGSMRERIHEMSVHFNQPITVQEFIPGYEVEVPLLIQDGIPLAIEPIGLKVDEVELLGRRVLTYDVVHDDQYKFYHFDKFDIEHTKRLLKCAENAATILGTEGFGRIDFRIKSNGEFCIMDASTYPHIIKHSSFWFLFNSLGYSYHDMFALLTAITGKKYNWI